MWPTERWRLTAQTLTARCSRGRNPVGGRFTSNDRNELHMLRSGAVQLQPFHIILSDIGRDLPTPEPQAGLAMLPRLAAAGFHQPVIFYVNHMVQDAGAPAGAFGITNRPDQLLHLVMDALSRLPAGNEPHRRTYGRGPSAAYSAFGAAKGRQGHERFPSPLGGPGREEAHENPAFDRLRPLR
jgi:hypothetical protein